MNYNGGREISEERLELALLVGMTHHERKQLEIKRGLSLKHPSSVTKPKAQESNSDVSMSKDINAAGMDDLHATDEKTFNEINNLPLVAQMGMPRSPSLYPDLDIHTQIVDADNMDKNSDENGVSDTKGNSVLILMLMVVNLASPRSDQRVSASNHSKLSLLGHRPHEKQVVDHILKEYGEDGIREFCQRWRQVLVEAIRP